jgi:hypothetical protein
MTYYFKITDGQGNGLTGFKTKEEAEAQLPHLRKDKEWKIVTYKPANFEIYERQN